MQVSICFIAFDLMYACLTTLAYLSLRGHLDTRASLVLAGTLYPVFDALNVVGNLVGRSIHYTETINWNKYQSVPITPPVLYICV